MIKLIYNNKAVLLSILVCFTFLGFRIASTQSIYFTFLVWNLFLAGIPLVITTVLINFKVKHKCLIGFSFVIWLLFIPNSPYIITDLAHLRRSSYQHIWLDLIVIFTFAFAGLLLFYKSFFQMKTILKSIVPKWIINTATIFLFYLIGFGIYLGRVLRYNSWNILNPKHLLTDFFSFIIQPLVHAEVWQFTGLFGSLLLIGYYVVRNHFELKE